MGGSFAGVLLLFCWGFWGVLLWGFGTFYFLACRVLSFSVDFSLPVTAVVLPCLEYVVVALVGVVGLILRRNENV